MSTYGVILIVLGFVVLSTSILISRVLRRRGAGGHRPGAFDEGGGELKGELERLLTDVQEISREHVARLDTKIRILNQLLLDCDKKKKELEALLGRSAGAALPKPAPTPPPARPVNPLHDQVYSLQDSGRDLLEICTATGLERGEVELILGLRQMPQGK